MNAYTTTTSLQTPAPGKIRRMFRTFCVELRRAIELAGAPYKEGVLPPL